MCNSDERFFEIDKDLQRWNLTCLDDGSWDVPDVWPACKECKKHNFVNQHSQTPFLIVAVNCTDPPSRPPAGTWEWQNEFAYKSKAYYTCGPYGKFRSPEGDMYKEAVVECDWNKSWVPSQLDPCEGRVISLVFKEHNFTLCSNILSIGTISTQKDWNGLQAR